MHQDALKAAEAAHCAGENGQYWQMHDRLFASQNALGRDDLSAHAGALGLNVHGFQRCLDSDKYAAKIRQDLAEAQKMSIRATPSFLLGVAKPARSGVTVVK